MNPEEIGRKVKELYPQYASQPDALVGNKYILKYGDKGATALGVAQKPSSEVATNLRKELRQESKDINFKDIRQSFERVKTAQPNASGDLSLIFGYMKLLDPASVVREGEQATAENARGVPESVLNSYNKVLKGRRLTESQRKEFQGNATQIYNQSAKKQKELSTFYGSLAEEAGADPKSVVGALGEVQIEPEAPIQRQQSRNLFDILGGGLTNLAQNSFKSSRNIAQDITQGLAQRGEVGRAQQSQTQLVDQARQLTQRALQTQDPAEREKLLNLARQSESTVGGGIQQKFSEDIERPYLGRALEAATEIAGAAELTNIARVIPGLAKSAAFAARGPLKDIGLKQLLGIGGKQVSNEVAKQATEEVAKVATKNNPGIKSKLISAIDKVRDMTPTSAAARAQAQSAAASTVQPKVDNFLKVGEKLAGTDPDVARVFEKQKAYLTPEKIKDVPELLNRMETWGRQAFTRGGTTKATAKAELYKQFYQEGLNQLKELAPEVYENRQVLRLTYELPKQFGRALWRATLGKFLIS